MRRRAWSMTYRRLSRADRRRCPDVCGVRCQRRRGHDGAHLHVYPPGHGILSDEWQTTIRNIER